MARKNLGKILPEYKHGKLQKNPENAAPKPHKFSRRNRENYLSDLAEKNHGAADLSRKNMSETELENYLLSMENATKSYLFAAKNSGEVGPAVFKNADGKMFALLREGENPLKLTLKCDPTLAEDLRKKYESVLPGYHMNKKYWNTILLTGQLDDDEIRDLARHSFIEVEKS